ncbi:hypothetical protein N431DRAFT_360951 [Stipitochalara longipes BDJ]|nr:hypothetical protein N431DRAFT_360951 [Stipitochalara longipes BDJ]
MSEPPSSTAPPRKRRRPALSCEQCRRRKIKCDRTYPCGQCLQSKTSTCSYSPDTIRRLRHVSETASVAAQPSVGLPDRARDVPVEFPPTSSAGVSPNSIPHSEATLPSSWTSPSNPTNDETNDAKTLLCRLEKLEEKVASSGSQHFFPTCESFNSDPLAKGLRGTVSKTRFFGPSHWMHSYGVFDKVALMRVEGDDSTPTFRHDLEASAIGRHIVKLTEKCKSLARTIKSVPYSQWLANPNFREAVPSRAIADILVDLYFKTSESVYRILHIPTFRQEYEQYWQNPNAATPIFILKLLLVMSIGTLLYQGEDAIHWRSEAVKWIFAAQAWLSSPFEKARLHTSAIQLQCLLLLARQDHSIAGDLVWISAGSLLRTAFQMGYHRDPSILPKMSPLQAETRRRLWATILEINLQSALDSGMPLLLSHEDFDTDPPANIDDSDLSEHTIGPLTPKPSTTFTQTSIQIALLKVFRLRLQVVRFANNLRGEASYDDVLRIGAVLSQALKENCAFISRVNQSREPAARVSQLQQNLFDLSIRRFLLLVHRPFAAKGLKDPHYYFSRKMCLDTAITMLKYPSSDHCPSGILSSDMRDEYVQLKTISGGFFKTIMVHVSMVIFAELWSQIEEDGTFSENGKLSREPLKQCLREVIALSANRITEVENNIKGHLFMSLVMAQVEAMEEGLDPAPRVLDAATKSADMCYGLLAARYSTMNGSIPPPARCPHETQAFWGGPDFGMDFAMQDWTLDPESNQDSWFKSGFEDGAWWHC